MFCPWSLWRKNSILFWWEGEWVILRSFSNVRNTLKNYFNKDNAFSAFSRKGDLSGLQNPACLVTSITGTGTLCTLSRDAGSWEGQMKELKTFWKLMSDSRPKELIENLNASVEFYYFDKLVNAYEEPFHLTFLIISVTQPGLV